MNPTLYRHREFLTCWLAAGLALAAFSVVVAAQPAPAARAMIPDRPSKTDGPFTLDAGRGQLELEFFTHTRDDEAGVSTRAWSIGSTFVRWGATPQFELQLGCQTYVRVTVDEGGQSSRATGFGDTVVRAKYNLWGNDGGDTAFALLPFVKIPTNQDGLGNNALEPGCSLPLVVNLPDGWQLGLMAKWSRLLDGDGRNRHNFFEYSAIGGHAITAKLSAYGEYWIGRSDETGASTQSSVGFGFGYSLSDRAILDGGVNLALNRATPDAAFFCGYSVRF